MSQVKKISKDNIEDMLSLTPLQEGMLFHYMQNNLGEEYFEQLSLNISGKLDKEIFKRVCQKLTDRHQMLRTIFRWKNTEVPLQIILKHHSVNFTNVSYQGEQNQKDIDAFIAYYKQKDLEQGFDLEEVAFRITLLEIDSSQWVCIISNHHILFDGWSTGIILQEFLEIYHQLMIGEESPLANRLPFKEYVKYLKESDMGKQQSYWKEYLADYEVKSLPKNTQATEIIKQKYIDYISEDITKKLVEYASAKNITVAAIINTAWGMLLQRYENSDDVAFGTVVSGRNIALNHIENTVGLFINTIPLRIKFSDITTVDLLQNVSQQMLDREEYEHTSLSLINKVMGANNNWFDSIVVIENYPLGEVFKKNQEGTVHIDSYEMKEETNYDITLNITFNQNLEVAFTYNELMFEKDFVEGMFKHFRNILSQLIEKDKIYKLSEIDILEKTEYEQLLNQFNNTQCAFDSNTTIIEMFENQVEKTPLALAVSTSKTQVSYDLLNKKANQLAYYLKTKGVKKDVIVGVMLERSEKMMIALMAILKAGGAYLPLDVKTPQERLEYIIEDSKMKLILQDDNQQCEKVSRTIEVININTFFDACQYPTCNLEAKSPADGLAYVIYTSGSTGKPKGVMLEHRGLVNRLNWMNKSYPINQEDKILQKTPYTFDVSLWELFWWSFTGASVYFLGPNEEKSPQRIVDAICKAEITTMHFVPTMLNEFLVYLEENKEEIQKVKSLKQVFVSGEALSPYLANKFNNLLYNKYDIHLINLYGPTEATVDVSYYNCYGNTQYTDIPIGKPIDNIKLYILDKYKRLQPIGVPGELCIEGVGLARGYLGLPVLTAEKFINNPYEEGTRLYRTGDLAKWLPDGNVEFLGRIDFQVKLRGLRIEIGEIEENIRKYTPITDCVVAVKNMMDTQVLCAYFTASREVSIKEIREYLSSKIADYMIPNYFMQLDKIPKTSSGKVNRKQLPDALSQFKVDEVYVAPTTAEEIQLAEIWKKILGRDQVSITEQFFNAGGDSIRAIRLISAVNKAFKCNITLLDLYANPTIQSLMAYIMGQTPVTKDVEESIIREKIQKVNEEVLQKLGNTQGIEEIYPMSDIQKGMVFYYMKDAKKQVYFEQFVFELDYEGFDANLYKEALEILVREHAMLRTGFDLELYKEAVQVIHQHININFNFEDVSTYSMEIARQRIAEYLEADRLDKFDITWQSILWRLKIFKVLETKAYAIFTCHHALLDGWSVNMLILQLHNIYTQLKQGKQVQQVNLGVTYKEAIIDELYEKARKDNGVFWKNKLKDYNKLQFPVKLEIGDSNERITEIFNLDNSMLDSLNSIAKYYHSTVKNICFAGYVYVLAFLANTNDVVVGFLTNIRPVHENAEALLGCFLNTIPVRVNVEESIDIQDFINNIEKTLLEIKKHERVSLSEICKYIGEQTPDGNPIFDTLFNYMDFDMIKSQDVRDQVNNSLEFEGHQDTNTLFDFMLDVTKHQMKLTLRYSTSILDKGSGEKFCEYFKKFIKIVLEGKQSVIEREDLMEEAEKQLLIYDFNKTAVTHEVTTMHQMFEKQVQIKPNQIALVTSQEQLTYAELNERSNQVAHLLENLGLKPGSLVAIMTERLPNMVAGIIGILKTGSAYVPIDFKMPVERINVLLESLSIEYIITTSKQIEKVAQLNFNELALKQIICLDKRVEETKLAQSVQIADETDICLQAKENMKNKTQPNDLAYIIFTSGSTGTPKAVQIRHDAVVNIVEWMNHHYHIQSQDKLLFITSTSFDLSVYDIFGTLAAGATIRLVQDMELVEPERVLKIILNEGITIWDSAPPALVQLVPFLHTSPEERLSKLRLVFLSGDWIPVGLPDILRRHFLGVQVVSLGGATEATIWSNYYNIGEVGENWRSIPYGKPIQNAKYYILDKNLKVRPIGTVGDLYIGGDCLAIGYANDINLTQQKFIPSPFDEGQRLYKTGDIARWLTCGEMEFLGRSDSQVKIRGYRIELGEIESRLTKYETIEDAIVIAKDDKSSKYLCAFIVAQTSVNIEHLKGYMAEYLPKYMVPTYIIQLQQLPVTSNGKIDRKALQQIKVQEKQVEETNFPRDEVEHKIEKVWKEILEINGNIPIKKNFFEIGGNSLNAASIVLRLRKLFNVELGLAALFSNPTIEELGNYIKSMANTNIVVDINEAIPIVTKKEYYPLSSAQQRIYFLNAMDPESTYYNATVVMSAKGLINIEQLEDAFRKIITRHEILRTKFYMHEGQIVQSVNSQAYFKVEHLRINDQEINKNIGALIQPFDLEKPPLIRVKVLDLLNDLTNEINGQILMIDMHHIVADGVSLKVITDELVALYKGESLENCRVQYKDYVEWQEELQHKGIFKEQEKYWINKFAKPVEAINLPYDYQRPPIRSTKGKRVYFRLESEQVKYLKAYAKEKNVTMYVLLLTIFNVLLNKYSHQQDIVIGSAVANRRHIDLENMIGVFANTLPIRNSIIGTQQFNTFVQEVKKVTLEAMDNQDIQFDELVEKLAITRDVSRNPLFDVMFILQNMNIKNVELGECTLEPYEYDNDTSKVDLFLEAWEDENDIRLTFEYCSDLFKEETIKEMADNFKLIVEQLSKDSNRSIDEIAINTSNDSADVLMQYEIQISREDVAEMIRFSDDRSPIHINPEYARRTYLGKCIVHGILGVIKMFEKYPCPQGLYLALTSIKCDFINPIYIDRKYICIEEKINSTTSKLTLKYHTDDVLSLTFSYELKEKEGYKVIEQEQVKLPEDSLSMRLEELEGYKEEGIYQTKIDCTNMEWIESTHLSIEQVSILACSSWLIGMRIPGAQALYTGFELQFDTSEHDKMINHIAYKAEVKEVNLEFGMISLDVRFNKAMGIARSLVRPILSNPTLESTAHCIQKLSNTLIKDKVIVVCGGSRGLGAYLVLALAQLGAKVVMTYYRSKDEALKIKEVLLEKGINISLVQVDLIDSESVIALRQEVINKFGRVDYIINPAYPFIERENLAQLSCDDFMLQINSPIKMFYQLLQVFTDDLERAKGMFVTISTAFMNQTEGGFGSYVVAKAAIETLTQQMAYEKPNIKYLVVRPQRFLSDQTCSNISKDYLQRPEAVVEFIIKNMNNKSLYKDTNHALVVQSEEESMQKEIAAAVEETLNITIAATFTAEPLEDGLNYWAEKFNKPINVEFAPYNQVMQQMFDKESMISKNKGINVICFRLEDSLRDKIADTEEQHIEVLDKQYNYLVEGLNCLNRNIVNFIVKFPITTTMNISQNVKQHISRLNAQIEQIIGNLKNTFVIDCAILEKTYSVPQIFDVQAEKEAHVPFTTSFYACIATAIFRNIVALTNSNYKVIVLDCDNTLWQGICGEDGIQAIKIDKYYQYLQQFMIDKYKQGILLALCSKNDEQTIEDVFAQRKDMILQKEHFVAWQINWDSKAQNIQKLAQKLNLGLDSFIFLDDSRVECEEVSKKLPQVLTIQMPSESSQIPSFLNHIWAFDRLNVTAEDRNRTAMYRAEANRKKLYEETQSLESFLDTLQIEVNIEAVNEIERASQMTYRTNQFNATGKRMTEIEIKQFLSQPQHMGWQVQVKDSFGQYGYTGLILAHINNRSLVIDSMMLSCRVLGRNVEKAILDSLMKYCKLEHLEKLELIYVETGRNNVFKAFIEQMPWKVKETCGAQTIFELTPDDVSIDIGAIKVYFNEINCEVQQEEITIQTTLHHIGVATPSIRENASNYKGYSTGEVVYETLQNSYLVLLERQGHAPIELVEPINEESPSYTMVQENRDYPYHLCYTVNSAITFLQQLEKYAIHYTIISELKSCEIFKGSAVQFIYIKGVGTIELIEFSDLNAMPAVNRDMYNTVIKIALSNKEDALRFFKVMGYKEERTELKENHTHVFLGKQKEATIELIIISNKEDALIKYEEHIVQIVSKQDQLEEAANNIQDNSANNNELIYKAIDLKTAKILETAYHKDQVLAFNYQTAAQLISAFAENKKVKNINSQQICDAPSNKMQQQLVEMWESVLHLSNISINDNFFKIGGKSLDLVRINSMIREKLNIDIPIVKMFQYPTIKKLSEHISKMDEVKTSSVIEEQQVDKQKQMNKNKESMKRMLTSMKRRTKSL